ncbi:hypothetical protein N2152v2_000204 [Parachlorella kessleri]
MDGQAGPSGAPGQPQDPAALAEADAKFEEGVKCIKENDLERAVALFAEVLKVRTANYGELAAECASSYYRYGSALLYQAQESTDVLGAQLGGGASDAEGGESDGKENEETRPASGLQSGNAAEPSAGTDDKGKAPAQELDEEGGDGEEDGGEDGDGAAESDLQLAWENLEAAKAIWAQQPEQHALQLADVHLLLGDIGCENETFEDALADFDQSLHFLHKATQLEDSSRRVAEVQYKRCMALQFLDRHPEALEAVKAAVAGLGARSARLQERLVAEADDEAAKLMAQEIEDIAAIQSELSDKVEELQDVLEQHMTTKNALQSAMATLTKLEQQKPGAGTAGTAGGHLAPSAAAAAAAGPVEQAGFDKPSLVAGGGEGIPGPAAGSGTAAAGPAAGEAAAPVRDLGVVGRGTKRLNLAPVQVNANAAAAQEAPVAKKKRSLEDLMGGDVGKEGETTIGFGAAPATAAQTVPAAAAAAAAGLPAFLQPTAVKAVYGEKKEAATGQ